MKDKKELELISEFLNKEAAIKLISIKNKKLINVFISFVGSNTQLESKRDALASINSQLKTNYSMQHINNWVSGRVETPYTVIITIQLTVLKYLFGDNAGLILSNLLSRKTKKN